MKRSGTVLILAVFSILLPLDSCPAGQSAEFGSPARLFLTSDPPEGHLTLDGKAMGHLPLWAEDIEPGFHDVRVSKEGFAHWFQKMYFAPGREYWLTAHLVREAKMNRLAISSTPDAADVFLDDEFRGITPITIYYLTAGEHDLLLRSDTLTWRREVSVPEKERRLIVS